MPPRCPQCRSDLPAPPAGFRGEYAACPRCGTVVRARPQRRPARRAAWATAGALALLAVGAVALLARGGAQAGDPGQTPAPSAPAGPGYVGAFRLPGGAVGESSFCWGGTALAFNPANHSLFMVGHDHQQAVAEVEIPAAAVASANLNDLPTARVLQPFVRVATRIPNYTLKGTVKVGGLLVSDGKLVGTLYEYYDAEAKAVQSHFVLDSLNLATAKAEGLFTVGSLGGGFVGGYMAPVPGEWQGALGAPTVTGQAALCIIGRTSSGPALFGFDPKELGPAPAAVRPYVYYPLSHPLGKIDARNPYFNGNTEIRGVFFVPGTPAVVFLGAHGTGDVGYGWPGPFNDKNRGSKGWHSVNGEYAYQAWAYDVRDFVAVRDGAKRPWEVKPTEVRTFEFPIDNAAKHLGGVAFDPESGRLYVSQLWAGGGDALPLIHVFQVPKDPSLSWLQAKAEGPATP